MNKVKQSLSKSKKSAKEILKETFTENSVRSVSRIPITELHDRPPKDLKEFEDRLGNFEANLRDVLFGFTYNLETGKTLKRKKSTESIVEALCNFNEYSKNTTSSYIIEDLDSFCLLRLILERDASLMICEDTYLLGFKRDRSGLSVPQKNAIAVQATAQVLWYLNKNKLPTIESMTEYLLNKESPFYGLLRIGRFHNRRTIKNWISDVFPIPSSIRKGRPSQQEPSKINFKVLNPIPGIFMDEERVINVMKLRFTIQCLVRVLNVLGWSKNKIERSSLTKILRA